MKFKTVADYFDKIENISSRLEITDLLSELFEKISVNEIKKIISKSNSKNDRKNRNQRRNNRTRGR